MTSIETPYYTIDAALLTGANTAVSIQQIPQHLRLNICVDENSNSTALLRLLNQLPNHFIISLTERLCNSPQLSSEWLPVTWLICSLHNYGTEPANIPVLASGQQEDVTNTAEVITAYFKQQGADPPALPVFKLDGDPLQYAADTCLLLYTAGTEIPVSTRDLEGQPLIIWPANRATDINGFLNQVSAFERHLKKNYAAEQQLLQHYIPKQLASREAARWQQRIILYQDFLSLSKSVQEKEYYEVLNWYHKEYETLPLWYKRLGHVIKVLTGKRTMRSLFSDNVKKYKD